MGNQMRTLILATAFTAIGSLAAYSQQPPRQIQRGALQDKFPTKSPPSAATRSELPSVFTSDWDKKAPEEKLAYFLASFWVWGHSNEVSCPPDSPSDRAVCLTQKGFSLDVAPATCKIKL